MSGRRIAGAGMRPPVPCQRPPAASGEEPVKACPPSKLYRFQKSFAEQAGFSLREGGGGGATGDVGVRVVVSTWQAISATRARSAEACNDEKRPRPATKHKTRRCGRGATRTSQTWRLAFEALQKGIWTCARTTTKSSGCRRGVESAVSREGPKAKRLPRGNGVICGLRLAAMTSSSWAATSMATVALWMPDGVRASRPEETVW